MHLKQTRQLSVIEVKLRTGRNPVHLLAEYSRAACLMTYNPSFIHIVPIPVLGRGLVEHALGFSGFQKMPWHIKLSPLQNKDRHLVDCLWANGAPIG